MSKNKKPKEKPLITPEIEATMRELAERNGYELSDFVPFILGIGIGCWMESKRDRKGQNHAA